ncbi:MAG: hypothetical protein HC927_00385 [Deltaproteobacteria bacterium]|nr:hypothetical protein [Deltaproteobacteria bacterium]
MPRRRHYGAGDKGTPALPNPACGGGNMEGMCMDGGTPREIVLPQLGEIVITEFMANPALVADADGEWLELRALASFDLNGLELGKTFGTPLQTLAAPECLAVVAGETILLAVEADPMLNGGLPPVDFELGFGLNNSNSGLFVGVDGMLLDELTYTAVSNNGASTSLDPDFYDPAQNDMAANGMTWCYAGTAYGLGDKGTPDAENQQCG